MPKTKKSGEPIKEELPGTINRSPKDAQEAFAKAHDSAVRTYGEGQRAHRAAYSALKRKFEKKATGGPRSNATEVAHGLAADSPAAPAAPAAPWRSS